MLAALAVRALDTPDPVVVRAWVLGFGPWAPVAFVALGAGHVVVAPVPAQPVMLAGDYLFGPVAGTAHSLLGAGVAERRLLTAGVLAAVLVAAAAVASRYRERLFRVAAGRSNP